MRKKEIVKTEKKIMIIIIKNQNKKNSNSSQILKVCLLFFLSVERWLLLVTTVQLPGGERVPFLFTVKELVATGAQAGTDLKPGFQMGGPFKVPSYRTGLFLDPKGRGAVTGYDQAVALPALQADGAEGQDELFKESNKTFDITDGSIEFEINKVNVEEGEIGGVFVSQQFGDTDMGSKTPKQILLKGIFYGRIDSGN